MPEQVVTTPPVFLLQRAYVKGASLEMPKGAATFETDLRGNINVDLGLSISTLGDAHFEVAVRGTLNMTSATDKSQLLVLEVDQAGIFEIRNIPEQGMPELLEIACPVTLTPYLRSALTDVLTRAGLPPFYLPEINWAHIRQQRLQAEANAGKGGPSLKLVH